MINLLQNVLESVFRSLSSFQFLHPFISLLYSTIFIFRPYRFSLEHQIIFLPKVVEKECEVNLALLVHSVAIMALENFLQNDRHFLSPEDLPEVDKYYR